MIRLGTNYNHCGEGSVHLVRSIYDHDLLAIQSCGN